MERKIDAVIEDVKLYTNNRYLLNEIKECHKMTELTDAPEGIQDLIVVTATIIDKDAAQVKEYKVDKVVDIFPVVIKYDGTLQTQSLTRKNRLWRTRFIRFLKHYGIAESTKGYIIPRNMNKWVGKKVRVLVSEEGGQIYVPHQQLKITT